MRKLIAIFVLIALLGMSTAAFAQAPVSVTYDNFYGRDAGLQTQESFVARLTSSKLKVGREALVRLYNEQYGSSLGRVEAFDALLAKLGGPEFGVRPCESGVNAYGFHGDEFRSFWRSCRTGEMLLVHQETGTLVFSLECGNMLRPPPPPRVVEEDCVEVRVHLVGSSNSESPSAGQPYLRLWGNYAIAGCGLVVAPCAECVTTFGQPVAAFVAPQIRGDGVIRLPRQMAVGLQRLCVDVPGYVTARGFRSKIVEQELARRVRERATENVKAVLFPEGAWLEFLFAPS